MTKPQIKTEQYQWSQGHTPRGRGMWVFELTGYTYAGVESFSHTGTYSEAKRAAIAKAREINASTIVVGA
jgi:hypothetical protein